MSGRRNDFRYGLGTAWNASLRITRPVVFQQEADGDLIVISATPGIIDDQLTLEMSGGDRAAVIAVRVIGSRPVAIDGTIRHELRVKPVETV